MKWVSAISESASLGEAVANTSDELLESLGGADADLLIAFVSSHHANGFDDLSPLLRNRFADATIIGCTGGGVIGAGHEVEHKPGFALTAASLPGVALEPFHIEYGDMPDGDASPDRWEALVSTMAENKPDFLILADPFGMDGEQLLMGLDYAFPGSAKIGGLASGINQPGGNALYLDDTVYRSGVVGLAIHGNVVVDTVVAQGCKPIGKTMHVTACKENVLVEIDGQTPFEALKEIFQGLNERDRELAQHSLFIGVVMDELNDDPQLGDFLIRNIMGIDPRAGVISVGEMLKEGQTVQFHLRDAEASSQDLDAMLTNYTDSRDANSGVTNGQAGALLFSCLGRGEHLFGHVDHDTDKFAEKVGQLPLTGFFCNGEIGQVGGSTYLHGYTSSFGIFRPKQPE